MTATVPQRPKSLVYHRVLRMRLFADVSEGTLEAASAVGAGAGAGGCGRGVGSMAGKLTAVKVRALTAPGRYGDGRGLWLQVRDAAAPVVAVPVKLFGRARSMGLAPSTTCRLRRPASGGACRRLLRQGIDPIEYRRAERGEGGRRPTSSPFGRWPSATSPRTRPAGAMRSTPSSGPTRSPPTPTRSSATCRSRRSIPGSSCRCWSRSGPRRRRRHPGARPDRERARLGDGARLAAGREPGPLARSPAEAAAGARQGAAGPTSPGTALAADGRVHGDAAPAGGRRRPGAGVRDPDRARTGEVIGARWAEIDGDVWTVPASA